MIQKDQCMIKRLVQVHAHSSGFTVQDLGLDSRFMIHIKLARTRYRSWFMIQDTSHDWPEHNSGHSS